MHYACLQRRTAFPKSSKSTRNFTGRPTYWEVQSERNRPSMTYGSENHSAKAIRN